MDGHFWAARSANGLVGLLVSGLGSKMKTKGERGGYRKEQRDVVPFYSAPHGSRPELSELCQNGAPGHSSRIRGHGRERRVRGFLFDSFEPERRRSSLAVWQPWPWVSSSWSSAQVGEVGMGTMGCVWSWWWRSC